MLRLPPPGDPPSPEAAAWRSCPACGSAQSTSSEVCIDCGSCLTTEPRGSPLAAARGLGLASLATGLAAALLYWWA